MITVISPGLLTTIQDQGRWGHQAHGMPVAGAIDRYAYRVANLLAANAMDAAAIEMTMLGATFHFERDAWVAICGADMQTLLNGEKVKNWSSFHVSAGSELTFGYASHGCRSYLAVQGGIDVPLVLGSRSTHTRARVGGIDGGALKAGSVLSVMETEAARQQRTLRGDYIPEYGNEVTLRVLLGPQDDLFTATGIKTLFQQAYTISAEADRMGYRLEGPTIEHVDKADIVSDALCQGAIQVPGHGMPIVMMADRQTTGGYAKIGTVIGPDLTILAQAKPGDQVRFVPCSDEEAVAALQKEHDAYQAIAAWLTTAQPTSNGAKRLGITINGQCYEVEVEEAAQ